MKSRWLTLALLCFVVWCATAHAQGVSVSVRLYTLHPQQRLKLLARTGNLRWRACERCPASQGQELSINAAGNQVRAGDGSSADHLFVEGDYSIVPQRGLKMALSCPVRVSAKEGLLTMIAAMPLEDYVAAALQGESANFTHVESLKAMAVAVRTYAVRFRRRHGGQGFDFCDNTHCQSLIFSGPTPQIRAAVDATRGELLWYKGSPAATYYHQNCGGTLAGGAEVWPTVRESYLREHADPYCKQGAPLPWKAEFSRAEFDRALRTQGLEVPAAWTALTIESRGPSGRVQELAFHAPSQPPQRLAASSLRFAIGRTFGWNRLRSDLYDLRSGEETVIFSGRGAGHGVGLCQAGAEEMAREAKSYRDILGFYYPGTRLGITAQGLDWQTEESEFFELKSTQLQQDAKILPVAQRTLDTLQSELGWKPDFRIQIRIFPTLDTYRNATGQPGWIAAYTRGQNISLQPLAILQKRSILEATIRHEFLHLFVESRAQAGTPLWLREGLVLYLAEPEQNAKPVIMPERDIEAAMERPSSPESLRRAYAAARTQVVRLVQQNGRETVLLWLSRGLPTSQPSQH